MIHLVGLPHTELDEVKFSHCAFTAKAARLVKMLQSAGRDVSVYWGDSLMGANWQLKNFDPYSAADLPALIWDANVSYWKEFNTRCIEAIKATIVPGDIVAIIGGSVQQVVVDQFSTDYTCIEPGVGYGGICRDTFCCFESYAWMHNRYGEFRIENGRPFDAVIPNAVDPDQWYLADSDGYALFVGRMIDRKGPKTAGTIANAAGLHCVFAGGGVQSFSNSAGSKVNRIECQDGTVIEGDVSYIGAVQGEDRKALFAHAEVFICPTHYIEPWGGVHAEAMMSGLGVVAPDYGVFTETLPPQFRYRTLAQAKRAVGIARQHRGQNPRLVAINKFSTATCTRMYDEWISRLEMLRDGRNGWYG